MANAIKAVPHPQAILRAWMPFRDLIGVTSIRTRLDYAHARATIEMLLDEIGDDETHPLADVLEYVASRVRDYEEANVRIPEAAPADVLRFLMDQHALRQEDLADCAPQSRISEILNGRRAISKDIARRLAERFHVSTDVFL